MSEKINHLFLSGCRRAIGNMRQAGMNEVLIACTVTEIRSAAIHEERMRVSLLSERNPPTHHAWPDMERAIAE